MAIYKLGQYVKISTDDEYNGYTGTIANVYPEKDDDGFEYEVMIREPPGIYAKTKLIPFAEHELSLAKKIKRKVV